MPHIRLIIVPSAMKSEIFEGIKQVKENPLTEAGGVSVI